MVDGIAMKKLLQEVGVSRQEGIEKVKAVSGEVAKAVMEIGTK